MKDTTKKKIRYGLVALFIAAATGSVFGGATYALSEPEDYQKHYTSLSQEDAVEMKEDRAVTSGLIFAVLMLGGSISSTVRRKKEDPAPK